MVNEFALMSSSENEFLNSWFKRRLQLVILSEAKDLREAAVREVRFAEILRFAQDDIM